MHATKSFYEKKQPVDSLLPLLQRYSKPNGTTMNLWFTTNHDENSWNGTEYEKYGDMAKALAVFSTTWDGVPLVYSGQELPNTKRLQFFEKDPIAWQTTPALADFYKTLFTVKKNNPALRAGDPGVTTYLLKTGVEKQVLAFLRVKGDRAVLVLLNLSTEKLRFEITDPQLTGRFVNVFGKAVNDFSTERFFEMQPWEYLVYEK
jgi:alpha-amylase